VFPLIYVLFAIPAGIALDRMFRPALLTGAWLTLLGGAIRLGDTFALALIGQILIAIAQPLVLNAVTKVAAGSLPPRQRPNGIALGTAGIFAGTALALPLAPALASAESLMPLLIFDVVFALAAAVALSVTLRPVEATRSAVHLKQLRTIWRLAMVAFLGFGVFVALTTWLQALLEPAGISDTTAGWLLATMVVAGVAGSAFLPPRLVEHHQERAFLRAAAVIAAAGCLTLAVAPHAAIVAVIPLGIVLLAALPVLLELTERRAAPAALIWLAGNTGGIVVAVIVQALSDRPGAAFGALAGVALLVLAFA
jgi:cyanate permease